MLTHYQSIQEARKHLKVNQIIVKTSRGFIVVNEIIDISRCNGNLEDN